MNSLKNILNVGLNSWKTDTNQKFDLSNFLGVNTVDRTTEYYSGNEIIQKIIQNLNETSKEISNFMSGSLKELFETSCFFAGGALRSMIMGSSINDYDVYFDCTTSITTMLVDEFRKMCQATPNLEFISYTQNALTFRIKSSNKTIQFISKYSGLSPLETISSFDFTNCLAFYVPRNQKLFISDQMMKSISTKTLEFNPNCWNPLISMKRLLKFVAQGFQVTDNTLAAIIKSCQNFTESDMQVLTQGKCNYTKKSNSVDSLKEIAKISQISQAILVS